MRKIFQVTMFWLVLVLVTIGYRLASKENQAADSWGINPAKADAPPPPDPSCWTCDSCGVCGSA